MVLADGVPYMRWAGVLAAGRTMGQPWRALAGVGRIIPDFAGDQLYDWVQRNRIAWFGRRDSCRRPTALEASRFLTA